jgi:hypothetical protein
VWIEERGGLMALVGVGRQAEQGINSSPMRVAETIQSKMGILLCFFLTLIPFE